MKYYGRKVKIVQFANDWCTIDEVGGSRKNVVVNPAQLRDVELVDIASMQKHKGVGHFWKLFEYNAEKKRFDRKRR